MSLVGVIRIALAFKQPADPLTPVSPITFDQYHAPCGAVPVTSGTVEIEHSILTD